MNYIAVLTKNQINRFEFKLCFWETSWGHASSGYYQ